MLQSNAPSWQPVINAMHVILLKDGLMEKLDKRYKHYWRWLNICIILMRKKSAQTLPIFQDNLEASVLKARNMLFLPPSIFHPELHLKNSNYEKQNYLLGYNLLRAGFSV